MSVSRPGSSCSNRTPGIPGPGHRLRRAQDPSGPCRAWPRRPRRTPIPGDSFRSRSWDSPCEVRHSLSRAEGARPEKRPGRGTRESSSRSGRRSSVFAPRGARRTARESGPSARPHRTGRPLGGEPRGPDRVRAGIRVSLTPPRPRTIMSSRRFAGPGAARSAPARRPVSGFLQ